MLIFPASYENAITRYSRAGGNLRLRFLLQWIQACAGMTTFYTLSCMKSKSAFPKIAQYRCQKYSHGRVPQSGRMNHQLWGRRRCLGSTGLRLHEMTIWGQVSTYVYHLHQPLAKQATAPNPDTNTAPPARRFQACLPAAASWQLAQIQSASSKKQSPV